jgi:spore maturation protein B
VTALADRLFASEGADSAVAKTACLLMGSTDTVLYTLGMYMSGAEIKKTRYAVPASLIVFVFSVIFCSVLGNFLFY